MTDHAVMMHPKPRAVEVGLTIAEITALMSLVTGHNSPQASALVDQTRVSVTNKLISAVIEYHTNEN